MVLTTSRRYCDAAARLGPPPAFLLACGAKLLGISQPRVSDLLRGRVELFSADALIDLLARLGIKVRLVASNRTRVA